MIITIDIGNTNTGIALISGDRSRPVPTQTSVKTGFRGCYEKRLTKALKGLTADDRRQTADKRPKTKGRGPSPESQAPEVLICSVVPKALPIAKRCVKKVFKTTPKLIGKDIKVPIKNKYGNPEQVGSDRLVCAYAVSELYGHPAIVVDLGTAITFDVVSAKKEYLGGLIAPGIRLSVETLFNQTALLPKITIHKPKQIIGKNTEESILSGIFYGYGEMIKGVADLLAKEIKGKPKIIVTGGYSNLMNNYIPQYKCIVDKDLIFKGMSLLMAHSSWQNHQP